PSLRKGDNALTTIEADHFQHVPRWLHCEGAPELLFTENETNNQRLFGRPNASPYTKDAINDYVVHGAVGAVNPEQTGTKAAAKYSLTIEPGETATIHLRLTDKAITTDSQVFEDVERVFAERIREADEFYETVIPADLTPDARSVMRQSLAGQLWSKQFYHYVVKEWLEGDPVSKPPPSERLKGRNHDWQHLYNADV